MGAFKLYNTRLCISNSKPFILQISQVMYLELDRREKQNAKEDQDIIAEHGEKALAAIEKLR